MIWITPGSVLATLVWVIIGELNAEIEHASLYGKEPGENVPGLRRLFRTVDA